MSKYADLPDIVCPFLLSSFAFHSSLSKDTAPDIYETEDVFPLTSVCIFICFIYIIHPLHILAES